MEVWRMGKAMSHRAIRDAGLAALLLVGVAALLVGAVLHLRSPEQYHIIPGRAIHVLGKEILIRLAEADRVQVFRVDRPEPAPVGPGHGRILIYPILSEGKDQGPEFAAKLRGLLLDDESYSGMAKACMFQPGVAFRLWSGSRSVSVLVCFHCNQLLVFPDPSHEPSTLEDVGNFDPDRAEWVRLAREAFPDDPEIQSLPDRVR